MASLDYDPTSQVDVAVKVIDNFGNPAAVGQNISFTLAYTPGTGWNSSPYLTSYHGVTDSQGYVKTVFIPGSFNLTENMDGSCILTANWISNPSYPPQTVTFTWMNYPYVSVYTSVSNTTPALNDTIDVTIKLVGNGKLKYRPITLMLDQDASSSMKNAAETGNAREKEASNAAMVFINLMDKTNTQMGLETFGKNDGTDASIYHMPIPSDFNSVITNLASLRGSGPSTEMYDSIITSLNNIIAATSTPAHKDDVKALILLSDGGSNIPDDKMTTLINTAKANGIYIFTISYLNGGNDNSQAYTQMEYLANQTVGKHYTSENAAGLIPIYQDIAKQIQILAGSDTKMSVSFQNILVNNTFMAGTDVYDYVPVGPFSPLQTSSNGRTSIIWTNGSQTVKDQSSEWPNLKFDVGSIEIGQTWSTTFSLRIKQLGLIKVFGDGSTISTNGGIGNLVLPPVFMNVQNPVHPGIQTGTLNVRNLQNGVFTDIIPLQWNTNYQSTISTNTVTEEISYNINGGPWNRFEVKSAPVGDSTQTTTLDIRNLNLQPDDTLNIKVHATAGDVYPVDSSTLSITIRSNSPYHIQLK